MSFDEYQQDALEYHYRKLERGVRMLMADKRANRNVEPTQIQILIDGLRSTLKRLGRKPHCDRWPL